MKRLAHKQDYNHLQIRGEYFLFLLPIDFICKSLPLWKALGIILPVLQESSVAISKFTNVAITFNILYVF